MIQWEEIKEDTLFDIDSNYLLSSNGYWNTIYYSEYNKSWMIDGTVHCCEHDEKIDLQDFIKKYEWYSKVNLPFVVSK